MPRNQLVLAADLLGRFLLPTELACTPSTHDVQQSPAYRNPAYAEQPVPDDWQPEARVENAPAADGALVTLPGFGSEVCLERALRGLLLGNEVHQLLQLLGVLVQTLGSSSPYRTLAQLALCDTRVYQLVDRIARERLGSVLVRYDRLSTIVLIETLRDHAPLLKPDELASIHLLLGQRIACWSVQAAFTLNQPHEHMYH